MRRITSSHVKTRRLYYLYKISEIIQNERTQLKLQLRNKIIDFSNINHDLFDRHIDSTGEVTSSKTSFERYFDLSKDFEFTSLIENKIINMVDGFTLSLINFENMRPYSLSNSLKILFLKQIIDKDFDYFITLFKIYKKNITLNYNSFVDVLNDHLFDNYNVIEFLDDMNRIKEWKSSDDNFRYNIFHPRQSWFIDLNIISSKSKGSNKGLIFKSNFSHILKKLINMNVNELDDYLNNRYYHDVSLFLYRDDKEFTKFNNDFKINYVIKHLDKIKNKLNIKNRISSRFLLEYIPIISLLYENIIIEQNELKEIFTKISKNYSEYRYRPGTEINGKGRRIDVGYITFIH